MEIELRTLEDSEMMWTREQVKKKLINQGKEILKQIGTEVEGIWFVVFLKFM